MARFSVLTAGNPATVSSARSLDVVDVIEIKAEYNLEVVPGIVLVLDGFRPTNPGELVGQIALIRNPGGEHWLAEVAGTRDHGTTVSIHLAGLSRREIPIGSIVNFPSLAGPTADRLHSSPSGSAGAVTSRPPD